MATMREGKPYQHLLRSIIKFHGSIKKAINETGIGWDTYLRLEQDCELTVSTAKKIMNEYGRMKNARDREKQKAESVA